MMKLSAEFADEVVLNLASPQRVSQVCEQIERDAAAVGPDAAAHHGVGSGRGAAR